MNLRISRSVFVFVVLQCLSFSFLSLPCLGQPQATICVGGYTGSDAAKVQPIESNVLFTDEEFIAEPRPWGTFCCSAEADQFSLILQPKDFFPDILAVAPTQCNPDVTTGITLTVVKSPDSNRDCRKDPLELDPTIPDSVPCTILLQGNLARYLDRRKNCTYAPLPTVRCTGSSSDVEIKLNTEPVAIVDQNAPPEWSAAFFKLDSISEYTRSGSLIHLPWLSNLSVSEPRDKWGSQNWNISSFSITDMEGIMSDILAVDFDVTIRADPNIPPRQETTAPGIRLLKAIPYKSCQDFGCDFTFVLTAFNPDHDGMNSSVNISLSILDENNLPPIFDEHETLVELDEDDAAQNDKLPQVHAYDQDVGINCSIRYSLERDVQYFAIDESTGQLILRNPDEPIQWNADNLSGNKYTVLIRATEVPTDDGRCTLDMTATTLVEIIVTSKRAIPIVVTTEPTLMTVKRYSFEEEDIGQLNITWNGTNQYNIETTFSFRVTQGNDDGSFRILPNGTLIKVSGISVSDSRVISVEIYDRSLRERYLLTKELTILTNPNGLRFGSAIYEEKVFETSSSPSGEPFRFNAIENLNGPCDNCTCSFVYEEFELPGQNEQNETSVSVSSWVEDVNSREVYRSRIDVICEEATSVLFVNWYPRPRFNVSVAIRMPESTPVGNVIGVLRPLYSYPYKLTYLLAADGFLMMDTEGSGVLQLGRSLVGREEPYETWVKIQNDTGQEFSPEITVSVTLMIFGDSGSGPGSTSVSVSTEDSGMTLTSTNGLSESSTNIDSTPTGSTDFETPATRSTETTPDTSDGSSVPNTMSTPINTEQTSSTVSTLSTETWTDPGLTSTPGTTGETVTPASDSTRTTPPLNSTTEPTAGSTRESTELLSSSTLSADSEPTDLTDDYGSTFTSSPDTSAATSTVTSDVTTGSWTSDGSSTVTATSISTTETLDSTPNSTISPIDSTDSALNSSTTSPAETTISEITTGSTESTSSSDLSETTGSLTSSVSSGVSPDTFATSLNTISSASSTAEPTVNIMANLADDFTDDQKKYFSFNGSTSELEIKDVLPPNTPFDLSFSARIARQTRSDSDSQPRADSSYVIALKTLSYTVLTPKEGLSIPEIMLIVVSCVLFLALVGLIVCAVLIHRYRKQTAIYNQSLRYPEAYGKKINRNSTYNSNVDFGLRANQSANTIGSFKSQSNDGSVFGPRSQSRNQSINPSFARSQSVLENDRVKLVDHLEADRDSNQTDVDQLPNVPTSQEIFLGNANVIVEDETHSDIVSFIQSEDEVPKLERLPDLEGPEPEPDYPVTTMPKSPPPPPPPPPRPDFTFLSLENTTADNVDNIDSENSDTKTAAWKRSDEPKKSTEPTVSAGEIFMTELKGAVSNPYTVLKPLEFEKDTEKTVRFGQSVETIPIDSSLDKTDDTEVADSPPVPVNVTLAKPPLPPKPVDILSPAVPKYKTPAKLDAVPAREPPVVSPPAPVYKSSRLVEGNKRVKDERGKNGGTIIKRQISETKVTPPIPPAPSAPVINGPPKDKENDAKDEIVEESAFEDVAKDEDRTAL